jgi:hypothetical protein
MRESTGRRFAAILPHALSFTASHKENRVEQLVVSGVRLAGLFSWAVEQGVFAEEIIDSGLARCCALASFAPAPVPARAAVEVIRRTSLMESGIVAYDVLDRSGVALTLLVASKDQQQRIKLDRRLLGALFAVAAGKLPRIPRGHLDRLLDAFAELASMEADLREETNSRRLGIRSARFSVPRTLQEGEQFLLQDRIPGGLLEETSSAKRAHIYNQAAMAWARMLLIDGILQVGLRRDHIYADGGQLGIARWAGTRQAHGQSSALLRVLVLSALGSTEPVRARNRLIVSSMLRDALGLDGVLDEIEEFCISLFVQHGKLERNRGILSRLSVREGENYCQEIRTETFCMLRQIVWIRNIGLACKVGDLTEPWREIAIELEQDGHPA